MSEEMYESRAIAQLVETQWKKWLLLTQQRSAKEPLGPFPTVAISRERGSGGGLVGKLVADRLGFVLFDSEIVDHVAKAAAVDRMIVAHMDERSQRSVREWTDRVVEGKRFSAQGYMAHLTKTILAAGEKGNAVIIGRGAHLLLPVDRCFRVRVIAPLEVRIERLCAASLKRSEAESIIAETDRQRSQFIQENFRESDSDPLLYDLVINTGEIAVETAAELVIRAVETKFPQVLQASRSGAPVAEPPLVVERTT
ncbi:MAG: cytidylate kinase-like family protein [Acidobacteria bacterium]|nr:cytidylate kinase-like family protein [Acidobacteriota bacterium]